MHTGTRRMRPPDKAGRKARRPSPRPALPRLAGFSLLLAAVCTSAAGAPLPLQQDTALRDADSIVRQWVDAERIPGAVLLVSRNGETVHAQAYGRARINEYRDGQYGASAAGELRPTAMRRLREPPPMTVATLFDLASVTKVMATTMAVMLLVDDGVLELDEPVRTYLRDFGGDEAATTEGGSADGPAPPPVGKADITLRQLLTHRSGLHQWKPIYYHAANPEQAYAYVRDLPLRWEVGTERHYSDLGFMLLGRTVAEVSGQTLDAFLRQRLFGPLGLTATGFRHRAGVMEPGRVEAAAPAGGFASTSHGNPYEHRMVHDPEFGYLIEGDPNAWNGWRRYTLEGEVNDGNAFHAFAGMAGHAGLFSNAAELEVLLRLLLNRGELDGRRYISDEVVATFLTPAYEGQALGWQVPGDAPPGSFAHTGFTGTYVLGVPAEELGVILLTNRQNLGVDESGSYPDVSELQAAVTRALLR